MQDIQQFADTLRRTPGIRAESIVVRDEADGLARLYYGTYQRRTDPKTNQRDMPPQMRADLDLLRELGDATGRRYFLRAIPVRAPTPDAGNPEWRLIDAPGVYTLQVAAFEPTDAFWEYKQAAAEYCKLLRDKGYEAYYHHTNTASMVTVGAFGPEAVVAPVRSPEQARQGLVALPVYSKQVLALQKEELLRYNLLNGGIVYVRQQPGQERVPVPSKLVEIPRRASENP